MPDCSSCERTPDDSGVDRLNECPLCGMTHCPYCKPAPEKKDDESDVSVLRGLKTLIRLGTEAATKAPRLSTQPCFWGRWEGSLRIDGQGLPCTLSFNEAGRAKLQFSKRPATELLDRTISFEAFPHNHELIAILPGTLPGRDVAQERGGFILMRLVVHDDRLTGVFVACASTADVKHLYPFSASLRRISP